MILLIDNYDSFAHNLARYFVRLGQQVKVVRNDQITVEQVEQLVAKKTVTSIVMSPGPGNPNQAGVCLELTTRFLVEIPILGICLGHQVIVQALGGEVVQWDRPVHGMAGKVIHHETSVFFGIPSPFRVGRYHSLVAKKAGIPDELNVTATLEDGTVMGVEHRKFPVVGLQFHPESILTAYGPHLLEGFLRITSLHSRSFRQGWDLCEKIFPGSGVDGVSGGFATKPTVPSAEILTEYPPGCFTDLTPDFDRATGE